MIRHIPQLFLSLLCYGFACAACAKNPEITDPAEAAKDPDFAIQGEYVGQGAWLDGAESKVGAQAIAQGNGKFNIVVTQGGLPGDGWKRSQSRFFLQGKREAEVTTLTGQGLSGKIVGELMTLASTDGKAKLELKRTVRHSSTEGTKAPDGAVVLFDGKTAENFHHGTLMADKNLLSEATTKRGFSDYSLHLEFRLSYMPQARGQGRSNSGVYLHDCYETQVLDSFGLEGADNECGGFYQLRKPDVNMCFPPLTWQTYDFNFTAPKYQGGKKTANARVTVKHNGVEIYPEFELARNTPGRQGEGPAPRPFYLQGHGNKVLYRNIWVVEKK